MDCKQVRDIILTDYLDGHISGELQGKVEAHLKECKSCQEFRDEVMSVRSILRDAPYKEVPQFVWTNVKGVLTKKSASRQVWWCPLDIPWFIQNIFLKPAIMGAGVFLLLFIGVFLPQINRSLLHRAADREIEVYLEEQMKFLDMLDNDDAFISYLGLKENGTFSLS